MQALPQHCLQRDREEKLVGPDLMGGQAHLTSL